MTNLLIFNNVIMRALR